jgi:uncharacterized protein
VRAVLPPAFITWMRTHGRRRLAGLTILALLAGLTSCVPRGTGEGDLRWGTSAVGSAGHRALVHLAAVLNRADAGVQVTVLPMPGAIMTMRAYAAGDLEGYYGADIAFHELAQDRGRFAGTRDRMRRRPVQTFWAYTLDLGLAVRASEAPGMRGWGDLAGRRLFTGPGPWDTRAHLERLLATLGVEHGYADLDLGMVGAQLAGGGIAAFGAYTSGGRALAPWVAEAALVTDVALLNPSAEERARLEAAGFEFIAPPPEVLRGLAGAEQAVLWPFYYGFHLGVETPAETVYRLLVVIEQHAAELARLDPIFSALAADMPGLQRRGVARAVADAEVHPGLARYLRERGQWDAAWDARVAVAP